MGTGRRRRAMLRGALGMLGVTLALSGPAAGRGDAPTVDLTADPWFVGWSAALPPAYLGVDTDSADLCVAGRVACVDRVAARLERQVAAAGCDHDAIFSLAYARTTEKIAAVERRAPAFFSDAPWLNHYDAVFADFYFTAYTAWRTGGEVPPAWAKAFDAAERRLVSATGNLLLGMSAHINRDLPFALYAIGLVAPDGTSRKADHDRVNRILDELITPLIDELAEHYDPSVRTTPGFASLPDLLESQVLPMWREAAWRNAERLAGAPNAAARARVAASIEEAAAKEADAQIALTRYIPPISDAAARDRFCAAHAG